MYGAPFVTLQQIITMWIVFSLLAALSAAVAITLSKAGVKKVDPHLAFAIQSILILIVSWSVVFYQKRTAELNNIDKNAWIFLVLAGIVTCLASLFQFSALKRGDASMVSSLERMSLVFAIIFAVLFLKEELNWKVVVGAVLMIGGALMIGFSRNSS